jgi:hypothetical protein
MAWLLLFGFLWLWVAYIAHEKWSAILSLSAVSLLLASVARIEQREIRVLTVRLTPDFVSLNPGYAR